MIIGLWKRRTLEEMLEAIRPCGIALRAGISPDFLFQRRTPWEGERSRADIEKGGFRVLLGTMGDDLYDLEMNWLCDRRLKAS